MTGYRAGRLQHRVLQRLRSCTYLFRFGFRKCGNTFAVPVSVATVKRLQWGRPGPALELESASLQRVLHPSRCDSNWWWAQVPLLCCVNELDNNHSPLRLVDDGRVNRRGRSNFVSPCNVLKLSVTMPICSAFWPTYGTAKSKRVTAIMQDDNYLYNVLFIRNYEAY
jgi:hypothetical protein